MTVGKHSTEDAELSVGDLVKEATTQFSAVIHGEIELAKLELKKTFRFGGVGMALFAAAGVIVPFSLTFGFIALAEGIVSMGVWRWAAYLIVFVLLLSAAGALAFVGFLQVKRVRAPQRTISEAKDTVTALRTATQRSS